MKATLLFACVMSASAAVAGAPDGYMKSATQVLLLGQACAAIGHAPKHDGTVIQAVADLASLGYGDAEAAAAVDGFLREKGADVTAVLKEEEASNPAAAAFFCDTAYPERLALHEKVRASLGLR